MLQEYCNSLYHVDLYIHVPTLLILEVLWCGEYIIPNYYWISHDTQRSNKRCQVNIQQSMTDVHVHVHSKAKCDRLMSMYISKVIISNDM